jgi:hypothetical protein
MRLLFCCIRSSRSYNSHDPIEKDEDNMKKFFIITCALATVFDGIAIMLGLSVAAKAETIPAYVFCGIGALMILAVMLSMRDFWIRDDVLHRCMRYFWYIAAIVNVATVFFACGNHIVLGRSLKDSVHFELREVYMTADPIQLTCIGVVTIFLTCAPIVVSHLWRKFYDTEEEEYETPKPRRSEKIAV